MEMYRILQKSRPLECTDIEGSVFVSSSYVGIEVEIENLSSQAGSSLTNWNQVSEGSIQGWEAVLREPMRTHQLFSAIDELNTLQFTDECFSERTSDHIHIDIRDMTFDQFMNFITLATMFEPVLYNYVASHRSHNHFCWSFLDCQETLQRITNVCNVYRRPGSMSQLLSAIMDNFSVNQTKYSGINVSSVHRYGSLEFRMHEGTADTSSLIRWINILLSIKKYAMGEGRTPSNILETKRSIGIDSIFEAVLGDYSSVLEYEGVARDILTGIRSAQDFVYAMTQNHEHSTPPTSNTTLYQQMLQSLSIEHLSQRAIGLRNA